MPKKAISKKSRTSKASKTDKISKTVRKGEAITKDTTMGDVVQKYPQATEIMIKHGLHCVGCHVAYWETIEQGCRGHGMSDKETKDLIEKMNKSINKADKR